MLQISDHLSDSLVLPVLEEEKAEVPPELSQAQLPAQARALELAQEQSQAQVRVLARVMTLSG